MVVVAVVVVVLLLGTKSSNRVRRSVILSVVEAMVVTVPRMCSIRRHTPHTHATPRKCTREQGRMLTK